MAVNLDPIIYSATRESLAPELSPLEYFLLNTLYLKRGDMHEEELIKSAKIKFDLNDTAVKKALDFLIGDYNYVVELIYTNTKNSCVTKSFLSISQIGLDSIYSRDHRNSKLGNEFGTQMAIGLADYNILNNRFCIMDLKDHKDITADLIVWLFKSKTGGKLVGTTTVVDPDYWSSDVAAIKFVVDPTKHRDSVYDFYEENRLHGLRTYFVAFSKNHKECIIDIMSEHNIAMTFYDLHTLNSKKMIEYKKSKDLQLIGYSTF